ASPIDGLYQPDSRDTMLVVPLNPEIQDSELLQAVERLGVKSLIFLRHIRCLSYAALDVSDETRTFSITAGPTRDVELLIGTELRFVQHKTLEIASPVKSAGRKFKRYWTEQPFSPQSPRLNKATGKFTPLGVCVCSDPDEAGAFHDRVPL